ncbi:synaptogyrin-3-like [Gambusia affinis]|uniref:synaptogyrin-3-like n=1 Tax=Gambusia affinis TaxID=33528 RepID=UPI001CDD3E8C|nr:synaptogyrin-3-like [Gambusia affinis]XP_043970682.1 synaptogyrin-3-like [Gambusia affinis]
METASAYGAMKAGRVLFDPVAFFTHPRTILRLLSWVFSIVVFSCIVNEGYINIGSERLLCVFNKNAHACNYGMTVGVACFLGSTCFLILDVYFPSMSNLKDRKRAVLFDLIFSGVASFLWFVGFCFLANQWQATSPDELPLAQGSDAARAIITFCFFSTLSWAVLMLSALRRYLTGSNTNLFTWQHLDPPPSNIRATPYPIPNGGTIVTTNPYQATPFTETLDPQKLTQHRPVAPAF